MTIVAYQECITKKDSDGLEFFALFLMLQSPNLQWIDYTTLQEPITYPAKEDSKNLKCSRTAKCVCTFHREIDPIHNLLTQVTIH